MGRNLSAPSKPIQPLAGQCPECGHRLYDNFCPCEDCHPGGHILGREENTRSMTPRVIRNYDQSNDPVN